jgi:hypothetical protein
MRGGWVVWAASVYIGVGDATSAVVVVRAPTLVVYFESSRVCSIAFTAEIIVSTTLLSSRGSMSEW